MSFLGLVPPILYRTHECTISPIIRSSSRWCFSSCRRVSNVSLEFPRNSNGTNHILKQAVFHHSRQGTSVLRTRPMLSTFHLQVSPALPVCQTVTSLNSFLKRSWFDWLLSFVLYLYTVTSPFLVRSILATITFHIILVVQIGPTFICSTNVTLLSNLLLLWQSCVQRWR